MEPVHQGSGRKERTHARTGCCGTVSDFITWPKDRVFKVLEPAGLQAGTREFWQWPLLFASAGPRARTRSSPRTPSARTRRDKPIRHRRAGSRSSLYKARDAGWQDCQSLCVSQSLGRVSDVLARQHSRRKAPCISMRRQRGRRKAPSSDRGQRRRSRLSEQRSKSKTSSNDT